NDDGFGRNPESEEMRRHEPAQQRIDQAANGRDLCSHDVCQQLVPERVVAEIRHAVGVVASGAKDRAEAAVEDPPRSDIDQDENDEDGMVEDEIALKVDRDAGQEWDVRDRNPDETV